MTMFVINEIAQMLIHVALYLIVRIRKSSCPQIFKISYRAVDQDIFKDNFAEFKSTDIPEYRSGCWARKKKKKIQKKSDLEFPFMSFIGIFVYLFQLSKLFHFVDQKSQISIFRNVLKRLV